MSIKGGPGRGQGRKPKAATGELMKTHNIRTTDAQWADFQLVGMDRVRELVSKEARRMRAATEPQAREAIIAHIQ